MKKIAIFIFSLFSLLAVSQAQDIPRYELGVILGEPLGISGKWWHNRQSASDIAAAWSFTENGVVEIHSDYLFHWLYPHVNVGDLPLYFGIGLSVRIGNEAFFGARVPLGIEYIIPYLPLSVFAEFAPIWHVLPEVTIVVSGGAGIRLTMSRLRL